MSFHQSFAKILIIASFFVEGFFVETISSVKSDQNTYNDSCISLSTANFYKIN